MIKKIELPFTIHNIYLRYFKYDLTKRQLNYFNKHLTLKEKECAKAKGKFTDRRLEYTLSRILIKKLYYDLYREKGISLLNNSNNCPKLYDKFQKQLQLTVGISHDNKNILIGISPNHFGIDCQKVIHFGRSQLEYYFSRDEIAYALLSENMYKTLTLIWGIKESYIKYVQKKSFGYIKELNVKIDKTYPNVLWVLINDCTFVVHYHFFNDMCICCLNK